MTLASLRRSLYTAARVLGDVQAVRRGPAAVGQRLARRAVWRVLGPLLRKVGL